MRRQSALLAIVLSLTALRADALVHGAYPGLSRLIRDSDHVVVAMVLSGSALLSPVPAVEPHTILVSTVLKGSIEARAVVETRLAQTMIGPITTGAAVPRFDPTQYYVLFLNGSEPPYLQPLVPGSAFWVASPQLPGERPAETRAAVEAYLQATQALLQARSEALD